MNWYKTAQVITYDFDSTLTMTQWNWRDQVWEGGNEPNLEIIQRLKEHARAGYEIHIVTSRNRDGMPEGTISVEEFVEKYDLPVKGIHYTSGEPKGPTLSALNSTLHHDDFQEDLDSAEEHNVKGYKVPHPEDNI